MIRHSNLICILFDPHSIHFIIYNTLWPDGLSKNYISEVRYIVCPSLSEVMCIRNALLTNR